MRPTSAWVLAVLVVGAAVVVYGILDVARPVLPPVPWTLPAALAIVAVGIVVVALSLRRRLKGAPGARPVDAIGAARMAALAKSCSHTGAMLGGAYGGVIAFFVVHTDSEERRADAVMAGLSLLAAAALVGAGLLLERVCRTRRDDEPPAGATG